MTEKITIALDAMGGDNGVEAVIPGAAFALKEKPNLEFIMAGSEIAIMRELEKFPNLKKVTKILHTNHAISADDKPSDALRKGKDSSMRLAIDSVTEGKAQAIVSSGNTGALMAMSKLVLKVLPGIQRPALSSIMPSLKGPKIMLDLGVKGNDVLRATDALLRSVSIPGDYKGFIEGDDITKGTVDVVVTDGFTGNVALKTAEGVGHFFKEVITQEFKRSLYSKLGYLMNMMVFKRIKNRMDPREYNGALFLGLKGICVKSHGGADEYAFSRAILVAANMAEQGFNDIVTQEIESFAEAEASLGITEGVA